MIFENFFAELHSDLSENGFQLNKGIHEGKNYIAPIFVDITQDFKNPWLFDSPITDLDHNTPWFHIKTNDSDNLFTKLRDAEDWLYIGNLKPRTENHWNELIKTILDVNAK